MTLHFPRWRRRRPAKFAPVIGGVTHKQRTPHHDGFVGLRRVLHDHGGGDAAPRLYGGVGQWQDLQLGILRDGRLETADTGATNAMWSVIKILCSHVTWDQQTLSRQVKTTGRTHNGVQRVSYREYGKKFSASFVGCQASILQTEARTTKHRVPQKWKINSC